MFLLWWEIVSTRHLSHCSPKMAVTCVLERERLNSPQNNSTKHWLPVWMCQRSWSTLMFKKQGPKWRQSIRWGAPRSLLCFSCGLLTCSNKLKIPWVIISVLPPADAYIVTEARDGKINRFWSSDADGTRDNTASCGIIYKVRRWTAVCMHSPLTCMCWSCVNKLFHRWRCVDSSSERIWAPDTGCETASVPTALLWNNFLHQIREVQMLSVGCLQGFLSAKIERVMLSFNLIHSGWSVEVRRCRRLLRGSAGSQFVLTAWLWHFSRNLAVQCWRLVLEATCSSLGSERAAGFPCCFCKRDYDTFPPLCSWFDNKSWPSAGPLVHSLRSS